MKIFLIVALGCLCVMVKDSKASQKIEQSLFKKGDRVHISLKNCPLKQKGEVRGTYRDINGNSILEGCGLDLVEYVTHVFPPQATEKLQSPIHTDDELKALDVYVLRYLHEAQLVHDHQVYIVKTESDPFERVFHETQLSKIN